MLKELQRSTAQYELIRSVGLCWSLELELALLNDHRKWSENTERTNAKNAHLQLKVQSGVLSRHQKAGKNP